MTFFTVCHPAVTALYVLLLSLTVSVAFHPLLSLLSFCGGALFYTLCGGKKRMHVYACLFIAAMTLLNPLFSRKGTTVLLVLNGNPVTAESLFFGAFSAVTVLAVLYWVSAFGRFLTSDRLLYLFGAVSPKAGLVFSIALRYLPLLGRRAAAVREAAKANGLYGDGNWIDRFRSEVQVFSAVTTYALEKGVLTADSMEARGIGVGRRTSYTPFRFRRADGALLAFVLLAAAVPLTLSFTGGIAFGFYPVLTPPADGLAVWGAVLTYGALCAAPAILYGREELKWKRLRSAA